LEKSLPRFEPVLRERLHMYAIREMDRTFEYGWLYLKESPKAAGIGRLLKSISSSPDRN
jgi:hypothetical protein